MSDVFDSTTLRVAGTLMMECETKRDKSKEEKKKKEERDPLVNLN